jgi:hypothetical protein
LRAFPRGPPLSRGMRPLLSARWNWWRPPAGASETCGSFRCGAPRARHVGMAVAACSALRSNGASPRRRSSRRARALTQRWMGLPSGSRGPAPWCDGPRLDAADRRAASSARMQLARRRAALRSVRAEGAVRAQHRVPRRAPGTKERAQGGLRHARKGDQGAQRGTLGPLRACRRANCSRSRARRRRRQASAA